MTLALKMADIEYDAYEEGFDKDHEDGLQAGLLAGLQQGIEQGIEQGAYEKALETAQKLIARGYEPEDIADLSGLPLSQVQELLPS